MGGGKDDTLLPQSSAGDGTGKSSSSSRKTWATDALSVDLAQASALGSMWRLVDGEMPVGKDLFRETHLRYLGYANELGEAFKPFLATSIYRFSYVVATGYVLADSVDKGWRAYCTWRSEQAAKDDPLSSDFKNGPDSPMPIFTAVADTLIWQSFASVVVPGLFINRAVWASGLLLGSIPKIPGPMRKWGPTAVGLSLIPLIVHPIDESVTWFMENTLRKYYTTAGDKSHQH